MKCPQCGRKCGQITIFIEHCYREHMDVIDAELNTRTIKRLMDSQDRREKEDQEIAAAVKGRKGRGESGKTPLHLAGTQAASDSPLTSF